MTPKVDTLYLTLESVATAFLEEAEERCNPFSQEEGVTNAWETPSWQLRAGRLKHVYGYDFIAEGRGRHEGLRVLWGRSTAKDDRPNARRFRVMIDSERCWRTYAAGGNAYTVAADALEAILGELYAFLPAYSSVLVRRLDVCVDHWGYTWDSTDVVDRFACRQNVRAFTERGAAPVVLKRGEETERSILDLKVHQGPESATYYVGDRSGAARCLRIYNKTAEARHSGKLHWMEQAWRAHGWDGESTVWRAEIEHGGEWLKAHGLGTMDKLIGAEHATWLHYLSVVRHTTASRSRAKRSPTSKVWRAIGAAVRRAAKATGQAATWSWQPRPPRPAGDMKRIAAMMAGCARKITETMFRDNPQGFDIYMREAMELSAARHLERQAKLVRMNPRPPPPRKDRAAS